MTNSKSKVDMLEGPLLNKIIVYTIPIMLSGLLQLAYNAADTIVVGRFAENSKHALAAVGATASLTNLFVVVCMGLSIGANVVVARYYGARAADDVSDATHTAYTVGILSGVVASILGFTFAHTCLGWMGCPPEVIETSTMYMRIVFLGMTFQMVYNFASGIIRATGDTKNPFIILVVSGALNVVLNLIFVIAFKLGVAGVAIATAIANLLSAILVTRLLLKSDDCIRLDVRKLSIHKDKLLQIVRIGIPSAIQGATFSLSNTILQSAINAAGDTVMASYTAANSIEQFVYISMNSLYHTSIAFVGQNHAAKKYDRVKRVMYICLMLTVTVGVVLGGLVVLFSNPLMRIYSPKDDAVVAEGIKHLTIIAGTYFTCGILDVLVGTLRGMGISFLPMISSIVGVCGIRFTWILAIYPHLHDTMWLYMVYPISWIVAESFHCLTLVFAFRKMRGATPIHLLLREKSLLRNEKKHKVTATAKSPSEAVPETSQVLTESEKSK